MQDTATIWLITSLLDGESSCWGRLAATGGEAGQPSELVRLAAMPDEPLDHAAIDACSASLRRVCVASSSAEISLTIAAATVLRLSALGHDDPAWAGLMPRWLVASLDAEVKGLGLLALAVNSRDRLACEDYAAMFEEALRLLPAESPLRISHLHQFSLYLGLRGMLQRLAGHLDLPRPGDSEPEVEPGLLAECFYDAVCCGRTAQATFLAQRIESTPEVAWQLGLTHLHRVYIPVFTAVNLRQPIPSDGECPSAPVLRALLEDDHAFLDAFDEGSGRGEPSPLLGYDGLRVALARRDTVAARGLLETRLAGPERHWLDDLFLARLLLLEDRVREAGVAFARLEAAAQRYGAMERIEIELTRHDCCRLGLAAGALQPRSSTGLAVRQTASADRSLLLGTSKAAGDLRQALERIVTASPRCTLIVGPDDGSTRALTGLLSARWGGPSMRRISATGSETSEWLQRCLELARLCAEHTNGSLVIDDLEYLTPMLQTQVLDVLEGAGLPCRLICTASPALEVAVGADRWRKDLFWQLAGHRLAVPALSERASDLGEMVSSMLRDLGCSARFETPALRALAKEPMPGGWAQLRTLCRIIASLRPSGVIDTTLIKQAAITMRSGVPAEGG